MDNFVSELKAAVERLTKGDPELERELAAKHGQILERKSREMLETKFQRVGGEKSDRVDVSPELLALETIVRKVGRPVLTIRNDDFIFEATDVESEVWKGRLQAAHEKLCKWIPSVGRVNVSNLPGYDWLGTAWLVDDDIVVTNRHVAQEFAKEKNGRFEFLTDPDVGKRMESKIDFLQEEGNSATRIFDVSKVLYIEPDENGPDIAFLQLSNRRGPTMAKPIRFATAATKPNQWIAAIGYPAKDSRVPDQQLASRIFQNIYDKKRLAPGLIRSAKAGTITHDASTLGGNSGSVLLDLISGDAVGLHRAGVYLQDNFAVPAAVILDRLDSVRRGTKRLQSASKIQSQNSRTPPSRADRAFQQSRSNVPRKWSDGDSDEGDDNSTTWTIPLSVTVRVGNPVKNFTASVTASSAQLSSERDVAERLEAAVDNLRRQLSGKEGVVDVRSGYCFRDGWITDEKAIVVATTADIGELPQSIDGFVVDVCGRPPGTC